MKRKQIMALLLSSTLTIAGVTPALAADMPQANVTVNQESEPEEDSDAVPDVTSNVTPDATQDASLDAAPKTSEDAVPEATPEITQETTPEVTPEATPEVTSGSDKELNQEDSSVSDGNIDMLSDEGESLPVNSTFEENYLTYKVTGDKEVAVTGYSMWDETGNAVIYPTVEHDGVTYQVTKVSKDTFLLNRYVKTITIKNGVQYIESGFMAGARRVSSVVIEDPAANMVVKDGCIYSSDMTILECLIPNYPIESYTTPDSVTTIAGSAFQSNTCKVVTLGDNVTTLEDSATAEMPAVEVFNMGKGITTVENGQFDCCNALKELNIKGSFMPKMRFVCFCPYLEKVTLDGNILGSFTDFFVDCPNLESFEVINSRYENSVDGVLFSGKDLVRYPAGKADTSYAIPEGTTEIWPQAFNSCQNLETLYIPAGTTLGAGTVYEPAKKMDVYLLDKEKINIGAKTSYLFIEMVAGSNIYCASQDRVDELNAYGKVAAGDDLPTISVKRVPATKAAFDTEKIELAVGDSATHEANIVAPSYANEDLTYESSDTSICEVDAAGKVTAKKIGDCTIYVKNVNGTERIGSYDVHVVKAAIKSITFEKAAVTMDVKDAPQKLKLVFDPAESELDGVEWKSSNTGVATVSKGVITPVKAGTATITASIQGKTATCEVTVTKKLEGISIDKTALSLEKGTSDKITLSYDPEDTTDDTTATWSTSDSKVATVKDGVVTAVGSGKATISVKVGNFTKTCEVTVTAKLTGISLDRTSVSMEPGETQSLTVNYEPADTTDAKEVEWSSSNESVVTVKDGKLTGIKEGTAKITAKVGDKTATCSVEVKKLNFEDAEITLSNTSYTYDGTAKTPTVTVKLGGKTISDYSVTYNDNVNVGTASVTIRAMGEYRGRKIVTFTIEKAGIANAEVTGISNKTFNGSAQTQNVTVKVNGRTLSSSDYSVSYKNNVQPGTATVMITGKGNYSGSISKTFKVNMKAGWTQVGSTWYYGNPDGTMAKNTWVNGYYMDNNGVWIPNAQPAKWIKSGSRWWYRHTDGSYTTNGFETIGGRTYYFDGAGWMATGWAKIGGDWYYFGGADDGVMKTGWQRVNGIWYYMHGNGKMATGWVFTGNNWYYMNGNGAMATGWVFSGNNWYYMNGSGAMTTGWQKVNGTWYYMNSDGKMATGWITSGGKKYFLYNSGAMATGWVHTATGWYYMNGSGAMTTGWQKVNGTWYYMYDNGVMAANTWIGNYYVNGSGAWVSTR